jgi:lipopolysaccharide cholinephosphotransferase
MMREDYDKLVSIAQEEFTHPLVFQTAYTEKDFIRGHAQIRNVNTSAIIPCEIYKSFNQGIFIDVFVLDYIPDNQEEYDFQCLTAFMIRSRLEFAATPLRSCRLVHFAHLRKVIRYKLKYCKRAKFLKDFSRYEDLFRGNKPEKCHNVALAAWVYKSHKRDASFYNETIYLDFEGLSMPVPKEYHNLLTVLYGDYMTPVMAASKHGETIISPEIPSDQMIKKLRRESIFKFGL